jgi:hypothetical protein
MTPRTPQCEVFWALLSSFEHSGVPADYRSPTFPSVGLHPTLGQSGVATNFIIIKKIKKLVVKMIGFATKHPL